MWIVIGVAAAIFVLVIVLAASFDLFSAEAAEESDVVAAPLPEGCTLADVDELRFRPALRGYRMDEVDEAIGRLRTRISELEAAQN
ncbi:hypothetical protein B8X04_06545 [Brevibacterium casei]|uniref:DivIVA domain-containing protein n=1 Tax=Brevibacterium casei TaxID=33889 RepID=A0A269ZDP7_9MICO|nr:hypothetical protein B8X04_06545 [Brevibacterium casei]